MPAMDRHGPAGDEPRRASKRSEDLADEVGALQEEVDALRRKLTESPRHARALE